MPPLQDMATLCEYPAGLNGSAVQFERCCGLGDPHGEHRPLPCPAVKAAEAARRSCASPATSEDEDEQQQPAPSRRVTRSRAGKSDDADDDKMKAASTKPTPKKTNSRKRARAKASPAKSVDLPVPCANSILGDDLILCRLSALLPPADLDHLQNAASASNSSGSSSGRRSSTSSTDSATSTSDDDAVVDNRRTTRSGRTTLRRPKLVRKVSSTLTDEEDNNSSSSSSKASAGNNSFSLIPGDIAVVLPPELRHPSEISANSNIADNNTTATIDNPLQHLLRAVGIEEVEALDPNNGGPAAGQCQFACIATALSRSYGTTQPLRGSYRPDLELRQLALHVIRMNPDLYRNFLTVAGGRTRKHSQAGGSGVDIEAYLRTMSNPSCDGDAVTLQALCDALKITIRIIKPVAADMYDEERQQRLLQEYYAGIPAVTCAAPALGTASSTAAGDVCSSDEEGYATAVEEDDDDMSSTSSLATAYSSLSWSDNPYSACTGIYGHVHSIHQDGASSFAIGASNSAGMDFDSANPFATIRQRLYVSQEIRPRRLDKVDTRIRDVQKTTRGRLIWLSHIGDEAHYRFLRPLCSRSTCATASDCPHGPVNEEEATIARRSQESRRRHLTNLLRSQEDGYVRPYKPQGRGRSASMDKSATDATENIVSSEKLQRLRKLICTTSEGKNDEQTNKKSPRCGLCFQDFFDAAICTVRSEGVGVVSSSSTNSPSANKTLAPASPSKSYCSAVSPSGCNHDFCRSCIQTWVASGNESPTCPTCDYPFCDLIDCQNQRVVRTVASSPIENDICCMAISNENTIVLSTKISSSRDEKLEKRQKPRSFVPPTLPASFSWSAMSNAKSRDGKVPPSIMSFNRQMLAEVSHELRFGEQMESPMDLCRRMGQVASMVDGPQLKHLLAANILRTLRILITPTATESAIRNVEVAILGENSNRYVVSGDIFRAVLAIVERINQKSHPTIDAIHDSLDLPKMLLWYMSCSELRSLDGYVEGLAAAKRVIGRWSKQHSHTIVDALGDLEAAERKALEAKRKAARAAATAARPPPAKKQKVVVAVSSAAGPKKNPPAKKNAPSKPPTVRVLPKLPPPALIRRGAGKRAIRPPTVVNISADDLSMRDWRQK